ncbi:MAG: dienelactone hydrolase family protein [Bacteroidota bacterium]
MKRLALVAFILLSAVASQAGIVREHVNYTADGVILKGYLAYNDTIKEKMPGILVVHEWWGNNDYSRMRADMLAELGYVALAVDMYGDGKVADTPADAGKLAGGAMKDMQTMKARFLAALDLLKKNKAVDPTRIAAIGYCFGGGVALNMACAGVDLQGVVSFHGSLASVAPAKAGTVKAKILICNGAADQFNPDSVVRSFKADLDSSKADYRFVNYDGAMHSFTNPASTEIGKKYKMPVAYNEQADKKSWADMEEFFGMIFKK